HLRIPSPLAELEFNPSALAYVGSAHVVQELAAHPPDAVFLFHREMAEYHLRYFGQTDESGRQVLHELLMGYALRATFCTSPNTVTGDAIDLAVPRTASDHAPILPPEL